MRKLACRCFPITVAGAGEVVGCTDTGVDFDSCYFRDDDVPVPINRLDTRHRKIVFYQTVQPPDGFGGELRRK